MMTSYEYTVAGHSFSITVGEGIDLSEELAHYSPFASVATGSDAAAAGDVPGAAHKPVFGLKVVPEAELPVPEGLVEEFYQDDDGTQIRLYRLPDGGSWFEFSLWRKLSGRMRTDRDCTEATLAPVSNTAFAINNALMVMYALSTARLGTALFHAAVIGREGRGYLFLGKSGTGKSTHARLWLKHIPGSELVNDDNPVVRVFPDGSARVYGSPWSGKTPCYRNMDLPAGGFVLLDQAPYNAIERLRGISAYAAIVPSISGKRWDRSIADGLHETENSLAMNIPVWHLDCLPDEAAARLCSETISNA